MLPNFCTLPSVLYLTRPVERIGRSSPTRIKHIQFSNKLHNIAKNAERQKTRLKNEEIPNDLYLAFLADFEKEKKEIRAQLAKCSKGVSNPEKCVEFAINYSMKLPSVWSSSKYRDKQRLQFLIFPEPFFYDRQEDKCRTDNANEVFQYIAELKHLKKSMSEALVVPTGQSSNLLIRDLNSLRTFPSDQRRNDNW